MIRLLKNVIFLGWLSFALASFSIASAIWVLQLSATVARVSAEVAATAVRHRGEIARTIAHVKAKARLRRIMAAVPLVGIGAVAYFEEQDFQEWLEENPEGTRTEYACEVAEVTAEVLDEFMQELPEVMRPSDDLIASSLPRCE